MNENIYEIEDLDCAYDDGKTVLHIDRLAIPKGKVVFFVGQSGIGKSTILETLGFMSKTVRKKKETVFKYNGRDVKSMWNENDKSLSKFRKENFSFVFQENNLMPNFKSYDNIITPAVFQGMKYEDARNKASEKLKEWGMHTDDRKISDYSGGERQRLALLRALLPKFSVLFADEPTGNLDCINARTIMNEIVNSIHKEKSSDEEKPSAIVVSHDIELSIDYAEMIVIISNIGKDEDNKCGLFSVEGVFEKNEKEDRWVNQNRLLDKEQMKDLLIKSLEKEKIKNEKTV